ncbi:acylphosphatase [Termitidicoccus mucosus]|uniref:acylphosphatase n=1 Tax=Termitidicoccus mucosus TaxID=1184151 RepID=A0A178IDF9_9BACT|nr:acylphosphatase [Opitutaceae bacterium TSB47]
MDEVYHETVFFTGHVQGVGFRYATLQVAREFEVSGFAANLLDGRVQVEAEGEESEVRTFIEAVGERMHGFIRKTERKSGRKKPEYSGFMIK